MGTPESVEWTAEEQESYLMWILAPDDEDPNSEDIEALRQERAFHAGFTVARAAALEVAGEDKQTPVTRDELIELFDPSGDDRHNGRVWAGMTFHPYQAAAVADAILAEFTLTRKEGTP